MRINSNLAKSADSLAAKLKLLEPGGAIYDNIMRAVSLTLLSDVKRRVFNNGLAGDRTDIGQYSTTPIYIGQNNKVGAALKPVGKPQPKELIFARDKRKSQNVKNKRTSTYFPDGYKGFRNAIGRPTDKVNLSLSGQLNAQYVVIIDNNVYTLGWPNELQNDIAVGQEKHWNKKIWKLTPDELKLFAELVEKQINLALQ